MGITCSKEFTLTVAAAASDLLAYWKCNEADGATVLVDEVSAKPWNATSAPVSSQAGVISTAVAIGGDFLTQYEFWTDNTAENPIYDFSQGEFTLRAWIKPIADASDYRIIDGGYTHPWSLWRRVWLGVNYLVFEVDAIGAAYDFECWVPCTDGAWHHVVAWYEKGVGAGMRINDAAEDLFPDTHVMRSGDQTIHAGGITIGACAMDEFALWTRKLTPAEITYDYNSGAGRTYPDVPT